MALENFPTITPGIDYSDAAALIRSTLRAWGLESLEKNILGYVQDGDSADVAVMKLRETKEYKTRFSANEQRRQAGLAPLSEGEYLATEGAYRQVMRSYGLPAGFYDNIDDFQKFIAADVSPTEMRDRVTLAAERYLNAPPEIKDQFDRAGMTPGMTLASILDPEKALPLIRTKLTALGLAGVAAQAYGDRDHLALDRAELLAQQGVDVEQARKGFGELAARSDRDKQLASWAGMNLTDTELENDVLLGQRSATRDKALATERSQFKGGYLAQETGLQRGDAGRI